MGRVFSWQEIESGQVPELQNFNLVGKMLRSELSACSAIIGALICGSFLRGDHNRRSDVDCVVLYERGRKQEAEKVLRELVEISFGLNVPLEFIPVDSELAPGPLHHLASTFIDHLKISSRNGLGVIKMNPVSALHYNPSLFVHDTRDYLVNKVRRFEKGSINLPIMSSDQLHRLLQKAIELPVYVARKILRCLGEEFAQGDAKKEILRLYLRLKGLSAAKKILQESLEIDRRYTCQIEKQLRAMDEVAYREMLEELREFIPKAFEFARINLLFIASQY